MRGLRELEAVHTGIMKSHHQMSGQETILRQALVVIASLRSLIPRDVLPTYFCWSRQVFISVDKLVDVHPDVAKDTSPSSFVQRPSLHFIFHTASPTLKRSSEFRSAAS